MQWNIQPLYERNLWAAVAAGDVDAARTLLRQPGVDVDAYDADGATLTYVAAAHGHTAVVELLADEGGADVGKATTDDAKALLIKAWLLDQTCAPCCGARGTARRGRGNTYPMAERPFPLQ